MLVFLLSQVGLRRRLHLASHILAVLFSCFLILELANLQEKKALREEKLKQEEKYMWAIVDGVKEKVMM